jgi:hypothetical protein
MKPLNKFDKFYILGLCCSFLILATGVVLIENHKFALWGSTLFTIGWIFQILLVFSSLYKHIAKLEKQKATKMVH